MSVRERPLPMEVSFPPILKIDGKTVFQEGQTMSFGSGIQRTVSTGHRRDPTSGHYVEGGPFYSSRVEYRLGTVDVEDAWNKALGKSGRMYSGPVYCPFPSNTELTKLGLEASDISLGGEDTDQMNADGATAIARCSPSSPHAALGQALIETKRDGLPSLYGARTWRDRALRAKNAGSEYLNHQFGWVPLVKDVKDGAHVAATSGEIAEKSSRSENSPIHRKYALPSESRSESFQTTAARASFAGDGSGWTDSDFPAPVVTVSMTEETKSWFSGSFVYALPSQDDFWRKHVEAGRKARDLLGLQLNPELLWEVAPWSWAVDWFSNVGDVISNVTSFSNDGQVMRYGYIMRETSLVITKTMEYARIINRNPVTGEIYHANALTGPISSSIHCVTKRRAEANPYGFGFGWEDLSPFQLSIAAALGISRFL